MAQQGMAEPQRTGTKIPNRNMITLAKQALRLIISTTMMMMMMMILSLSQVIAADFPKRADQLLHTTFVHTKWLVRDGAPPGANDIAQTPDGWIWFSSPVGLFRFDGMAFTRFKPPLGQTMASSTTRIGVLNDGTLWAAAKFGGLYLIKDESFRVFKQGENNFPQGAMGDVLRDNSGTLWVASWQGLFSLPQGSATWRKMNAETGLPETPVNDLLLDKNGTMWALAPKAIYARPKQESRFRKVSDKNGWGRLAESPDHSIWSTDMSGKGVKKLWPELKGPKDRFLEQPQFNAFNFLIDRSGSFWLPKNGELIKIEFAQQEPQVKTYASEQGLSGATVNAVFEDHEGSIWVATDHGINQTRPSRMALLSQPAVFGEAQALLGGSDGELWIDNNYFRHIDNAPEPFAPRPQQKDLITALYRDPHGIVWCASLDGLWKLDGLKRKKVNLPPEINQLSSFVIYALAMDEDSGLWLSLGLETWRMKDGIWKKYGGLPALKNAPVTAMTPGLAKSLWLGSLGSTIYVLRNGQVHKLDAFQNADIGTVMQIVPRKDGALVSGENGLVVYDGRRIFRIRGEHDELFPGITGLVVMPNGDLWANSGVGLFHISATEIVKLQGNPNHAVRYRKFDENDGLIGTAPPHGPLPSMIRTGTGELIISTLSGTYRFNPAQPGTNMAPAPVKITGIAAAGNSHSPTGGLILDSAADSVRIDYTALSFTSPQRVNFRYKLDGIDQQWQEAGTLRTAIYTNLAPGKYTFKVVAANEDGLWDQKGAEVSFEIPPTVTQTGWFKLLCLLILLMLAWSLHRLRLHVALRRLAVSFEVRAAERERIARDLHDTLLQSVQGLILVFTGIVKRLPDSEPLKARMENALEMATGVMNEGRHKVTVLRSAVTAHNELTASLEHFGYHLAEQHKIAFTMQVRGEARPLRAHVHDELLMIGREAMRNAFAHAHPTNVTVDLAYDDKGVTLCVTDNGCGIDTDLQMGRPGHWGVEGMRERAAQLGASIGLCTGKGQGTTWKIQIAAQLAYSKTGTSSLL
ncbi:sensor histidine kinase [Pseudoduganella lutea]|uniref:Histidine kinase/HSP90-like ATPase domain-containing protein n=1 Tax=Pseudoduganella lutea TaxID=321985 RepID=A0A4P6L480_9BURK|nr:sensor histidine kinase [Pseudoduganella lutea]QBE66369.1 hypothetical protein EWM63_28175 [Pseudoduganella lutea]